MRWHCSPDHRLTLYIAIPCSRHRHCGLRLSLLLLGHGCSPQYWIITSELRRNILFLWSLNATAGFESAISRLSKQAVLTTAPGSPPYIQFPVVFGVYYLLLRGTKLYRLPLVRARDDLTLFRYIQNLQCFVDVFHRFCCAQFKCYECQLFWGILINLRSKVNFKVKYDISTKKARNKCTSLIFMRVWLGNLFLKLF